MPGQSLNHVKSQVDLKIQEQGLGQGLGQGLDLATSKASQVGQVVHHKMWVPRQVQVPQLTWTQVHQIWV